MFGIAIASIGSLDQAEKDRYQAIYCGLCLELKRRYGQVSRASLSYDLAFLAMLYMSLYEPAEEVGQMRCPTHPGKRVPYVASPYTSYCADLSVALAYHKCLDDITDEGGILPHMAKRALSRSYEGALSRIPVHCEIIADTMSTIALIEGDPESSPDEAANAFGELLGFLFECCPSRVGDLWGEALFAFGRELGRFIYLMDAAVDFSRDEKSGSYNPFVRLAKEQSLSHLEDSPNTDHATAQSRIPDVSPDPKMMRDVLSVMIGQATKAFDKLPLVQDAHLMESVLYSGVWQSFNKEYQDRDARIFNAAHRTSKINV